IELVPLHSTKNDEIVTAFDMNAVEKMGLLKMDFLGLTTLTVLDHAQKLIRQNRGVELDLAAVPLDDPATYQKVFHSGLTSGVFQFESQGMRDVLRRYQPTVIEDLTALNALYRPGPIQGGMIDDFIDRRHGRKPIHYELPELEEILRETLGVIVYQEQVMQIANRLAGYSLGEADLLRRAMGKKKAEEMAAQREKFVHGAVQRGFPERTVVRIFDLMEQFAGYGFNKSHSAAYALLAYHTAYLKTHYPVEFMASLLTSETGATDKVVKYINECREMGIRVEPPDLNVSDATFTPHGDAIRFGLAAVKNVGHTAIESIVEARTRLGRFRSLFEFAENVDLRLLNKRVLESLIKSGALDPLGRRAQLMAVVDRAMEAAASSQRGRVMGQVSLLDALESKGASGRQDPALPAIPEWSRNQRLAAEKETLGFYITGHPLADFREIIARQASVTTDRLPSCRDKELVKLCAIVAALKEITTKNGERMAFVTLEDLAGTVEAIVFPELYKANMLHLVKDAPLLVKGQVDIGEETVKLLLTDIKPLSVLTGNGASVVEIIIEEAQLSVERLEELKALLSRFPGTASLRLHLGVAPGARVTIDASPGMTVTPNESLKQEVEALLGPGTMTVV
ncbi:MAG: dnaE, partial [candidate division NC10 bacterium]|nr:dnaE [candidate division NC10 bacterium]